jgi:hypothetical protein
MMLNFNGRALGEGLKCYGDHARRVVGAPCFSMWGAEVRPERLFE